jgi:F-type H+-transporting ATPase subunit b
MRIDWWTLGLQTINALVLVWLLARFLFRPVADIIARRKAEAERLLDDAEQAKADAKALFDRADGAWIEIAANRAAAVHAALAEAQCEKDALLAGARAEIERMRAQAAAEFERARKTERRAANERASQLAAEIARRLVERLRRAARVAGFVDGLARAVAALPEPARASLAAPGPPARLTAPRPLTQQEEELCRRSLAQALGHPLDLAIETDPALIAGLELENQHASIRNSFRADLARIAADLEKQDGDDAR